MPKINYAKFSILFFLIANCAFSQTAPQSLPGYTQGMDKISIIEQANDFYKNGDAQKALDGYMYVYNQGVTNGQLFYNIANTQFSMGKLGQAILWYERALRYSPRFEDLKTNYEFARGQLADVEFKAPEYSGTIGFLLSLHKMINIRETFFLLTGLFWLFMAFLISWVLIRSEIIRSWLRIPCWSLFIAVILFSLSFGYKAYRYEFVQEAIIMDSAVEVRTGPGKELSVLFPLHEGTKVILAQQQGEWQRIYLPGNKGFTGWLPKASVQEI